MIITNTTIGDLDVLEALFDEAISFQRSRSASNVWQRMNREFITREIEAKLHWKIVDEDQIACCFSMLYTDPLVWDEKDADPSLYLHRIVTNPAFGGRAYVKAIVSWASDFGRATGKKYLRLDTGRDNRRLNEYYQECGFVYCGSKQFRDDGNPAVPRHYLGVGLSLYEKRIE